MLKRTFCLLAALVMLTAIVPLSVSADGVTITATNMNSSRGSGELVIYTDAYGESTRTNFWGAEAIVDADHCVISIGMGNSEIPAGGFVVSGHDDESEGGVRMKTWVTEHIDIGDYVYFDARTLQLAVFDTPQTDVFPVFFETSQTISSLNGSRDQDTLVVYTGMNKTTGTNGYGYEVTVADGIVTVVGGNNSTIPDGGFVVSGHGTMATWLRAAVVEGMSASYDREAMTVTFAYSADSLQAAVQSSLAATQQAIADAKKTFVYADYAAVDSDVAAITAAYDTTVSDYKNGGDDTAFASQCEETLSALKAIRARLCDSYTVQYRGVWVRPTQRSAIEVDQYVRELKDNGINTVSVEAWFESGMIMELPEDSLFEKNSRFQYDVLQAYIDACHKYGMECHLWMPVMYVGDQGRYYERSLLSKKPEWASLNENGELGNTYDFLMIDPANEEARAYLVEFYRYLVTTYDIDGFELDYIRYHETDEHDFGYTDAAFAGFEAEYGYGVTPTYDTKADYWEDWVQYRCDRVTDMVVAVREMMDDAAPDVLLSASVGVDPAHTRYSTHQDFGKWLDLGLLDMVHSMAYGDGYGDILASNVERGGIRTMTVPGLGPYVDSLNAPEMDRQARENNTIGAYGDFYFEAKSYLGDNTYDTLKHTVYRNEAIAPFIDVDASLVASLAYMQGRIEDVMVPLGGVTDTEKTALLDAIAAASASVKNGIIDETASAAIEAAIAAVTDTAAKATLEADWQRTRQLSVIVHGEDFELPTDEPTTSVTAPSTTATASAIEATSTSGTTQPAETSGSISTTTVLIVVAVVLVGIGGGAFGVWRVVLMKQRSAVTKEETTEE